MNVNELNIKEHSQALQLLDDFKQKVEAGEIMSLIVICEGTDGSMMGGTTATQNQFAVAGYMLSWAMRRLGFTTFDDVRMMAKVSQGPEKEP
jgi:hypothetical protein